MQIRENMPTLDPEHGELRTITQLVLDASEVWLKFDRYPHYLTFIIGTHPLPIIHCYEPIRISCYPNTSCPPLPAPIPPRLRSNQIKKKFGLEIESGDDEIGFHPPTRL